MQEKSPQLHRFKQPSKSGVLAKQESLTDWETPPTTINAQGLSQGDSRTYTDSKRKNTIKLNEFIYERVLTGDLSASDTKNQLEKHVP